MSPKRKTIAATVSSKTTIKRQSERVVGKIVHEANKSDVNAQKQQSRPRSTGKKNKRCYKSSNLDNDLEVITEEDLKESPKSMSIDSNDTDSGQQELSMSNSCSSNRSYEDKNVKTSTASQFDIADDDTSEFEAMFMPKTPRLKAKSNYNSTPLVRSQHHNLSGIYTNAESLSLHGMENNISTPLSTIIINHQSTTPNTSIQKLNTPSNPRAKSNLLSSSQASVGNQSLSNINYTTNNSAILETFSEYRNLKRDLQHALNQIESWKSDYNSLKRQMEKLKKSSFPRPTAEGRVFIEQLLESLKSSEDVQDKRSLGQLAIDIGVPETILLSSSNIDPQKSALNIFNYLFPTNEDKVSLLNVAKVMIEYPNLLDDIFGK
ncbi:unnamed protein product [Rotaria sp. Silwood1]|nr:unnamed protein product [Rotaria sp. Silwood1]